MERINNWVVLHASERIDAGMRLETKLMEELLTEMPVLKCLYELHSLESRFALLGLPRIAKAIENYRGIFSEIDLPKAPAGEKLERYGVVMKELESRSRIVFTLMAESYQKG